MLSRRAWWGLVAALSLLVLLALGAGAFFWLRLVQPAVRAPIEGTVVEVDGEQVVIAAQDEPIVGEPVTIYFAIPGLDQLGTVGSGTVREVEGSRATAAIERRTGDLAVGQIAKIGEVPADPVRAPAQPSRGTTSPAVATAGWPDPPGGPPAHPVATPAPPQLYPPPSEDPLAPRVRPADGPATAAGRFVGCFADTSDFDLDGHLERSPANTPQRCIDTCRALGFRYAGVQYGESCLCGNRYGRYGAADNCNYRCTGDPGQICGGYSANSVYETGASGPDLRP